MFFEKGNVYNRETGFGTPHLPILIKVLSQSNTSKSNLVEMAGVKPASKKYSFKN